MSGKIKITKLEALVPSAELCTKIPSDCFEGTYFVWAQRMERKNEKSCHWEPVGTPTIISRERCGWELGWDFVAPAPTLSEIWEELKEAGLKVSFSRLRYDRRWYASVKDPNTAGPECLLAEDKKSSTNAALKVWLKLKGINYEDWLEETD